MITLLQQGTYQLIETKKQIKILLLDQKQVFAWINAFAIGEILVVSHNHHKLDHILAQGPYRLYQVKEEPQFTDLTHLELFVGNGMWQGYLLPTGLPHNKDKKNRIIPTQEYITT